MNGKVLIVMLVVIALLYAGGLVIGMRQSDGGGARPGRDNALPRVADRLLGWAAPSFDLDDLRVDGKPAARELAIEPGRTYRLEVAASSSESRRLAMSFDSGVPAIWTRSFSDLKSAAVYFVYEPKDSLPDEMTDEFPSPQKSIVPNMDQDDAKRRLRYDWPIMKKGAVISVRSTLSKTCKVTIQ